MMANFKSTFLVQLYKGDKKLFALVSIFVAGTLFCIFNCNTFLFSKRCEEFPFLLYGMYSLKEPPQATYTTYSIFIGGEEVNYSKLKDSQRELLTSPLIHSVTLVDSTAKNNAELQKLREWLFRYSVDMRGLQSNKMEVYKLTCAYNEVGLPHVMKKELLYVYALQ